MDGRLEIPAGSLTTDPGVRAEAHIFVASKLPWYAITDGLPQHATFPPGDRRLPRSELVARVGAHLALLHDEDAELPAIGADDASAPVDEVTRGTADEDTADGEGA